MALVLSKGENFDTLLKKFKRKVDKHGILLEKKQRMYYLKPSEAKKKKEKKSRMRIKKEQMKEKKGE